MSDVTTPTIYAIDFGTSNSLLAAANAERVFPPVPLDSAAREPTILRSLLYFSDDARWFFGDSALQHYVAQGMRGRIIRSIKRFLPMASFTDTAIGSKRIRLEELIGIFLREMRTRANAHFGTDVKQVLLGRPARFSENPEDDALAERRLEQAARLAGFERVAFCAEPVAAAHDFEAQIGASTMLLVADLGGGTSDFTVAKLEGTEVRDVLAVGGVPTAGDALDGSLMRHKIARHFGSEVTYRVPFGKNVLSMPLPLVEKLCSPADLSVLARSDVTNFLRDVQAGSLGESDREHIEQLLCLIEDALGFQLFEAIEATKRALTDLEVAPFDFEYVDIGVHDTVRRVEFDAYIAPHVAKIEARMLETLATARLTPADIDLVCITGGTGRVPAVRERLLAIFGVEKLHGLSSFHSVIRGLAERARSLAAAS
jgi:hypothetical chaperone protein